MIILKFSGQLGNQMFEYACAYALAKENGQELSVYDFDYKTIYIKLRNQIKTLNLDSCKKNNPCILYWDSMKKIVCKTLKKEYRCTLSDKKGKYQYLKDAKNGEKNTFAPIGLAPNTKYYVLDGYFQSPLYFDKYRADLLRQFVPRFRLSRETNRYLEKIQQDAHSVSLHIRRGDYIRAGLDMGVGYYQNAIREMTKRDPSASFYVFSDDLAWAKENLDLGQQPVCFMERTAPAKPFEDIWLMSKCRNHIIANSTFSWWGAYLDSKEKPIVFAPEKLINNNDYIMPEGWTVL